MPAPKEHGSCRTVVVDVGPPHEPTLVLTQAHPFVADTTGRATPAGDDPCDPTREAPGLPPPAPTASSRWVANGVS
jgi:hypothetical protein